MKTRSRAGLGLIELLMLLLVVGVFILVGGVGLVSPPSPVSAPSAKPCVENLSMIDGAKEQLALEMRLSNNSPVAMSDLVKPDGTGSLRDVPVCPDGGVYTVGKVGVNPTCSMGQGGDSRHRLPDLEN